MSVSSGVDTLLYILTFAFVILGMYVVFAVLRAAARFLILAAAGAAFWYVHTKIAAGEVATAWDAVRTAALAGAAAAVVCSPLLPLLDTGSRRESAERTSPAESASSPASSPESSSESSPAPESTPDPESERVPADVEVTR